MRLYHPLLPLSPSLMDLGQLGDLEWGVVWGQIEVQGPWAHLSVPKIVGHSPFAPTTTGPRPELPTYAERG